MHCCRVCVVLCFITLLANAAWVNAPVWHESSQLVSGLNILKFGRFDTQTVNPPLVRAVSVIPSLALSPNLDNNIFNRAPVGRDEFHLGVLLLKENVDTARALFFVSRLACIFFAFIGILVCYRFARDLFSPASGTLVLLVACFCPLLLGMGPTVMNDVPAACMGVLSVYFFWKWLKRPELPRPARVFGQDRPIALSLRYRVFVI